MMGWQDAPVVKSTGNSWKTVTEIEKPDNQESIDSLVNIIPTGIAGVTDQKYSSAPPQPKPTIRDRLIGAGEAGLSVLTGATAGSLGYLGGAAKGIGQEFVTGEFGQGIAEREAGKGASIGTYAPRTQAGQQYARSIGEAAQQLTPLAPMTQEIGIIGESLRGMGPMLKRNVQLVEYGEPVPALRKSLEKRGLTYENLTPMAKSEIPEVLTQSLVKSTKSAAKETTNKALVAQIKSGARDDALAGFKVVGDTLQPDKFAHEALRQGFEPGYVQMVKTATPQTRAAMDKMLTMIERIQKNQRLSSEFRPTDIAGKEVIKRVSFLRDKANQARTDLNAFAENKLRGVKIDTRPIVGKLQESLDKLDVRIETGPNGMPQPNFVGSMISKDRTSQRIIRDLVDVMGEGGAPDALRFHKLKRQLDVMIDYRKKSAGGLTDAGKNVLKDIRVSLNESLRQSNPQYAKINDTLSSSLGALDDFNRALGPSIDMFGENADKAIGVDLRGLLSNRKTRINLENALNNLDDVANQLGGKFDVNYKDLIQFSTGLEDRFGAVAKTSFQGGIESALKSTQDYATNGATRAATDAAFRKAQEAANKIQGINDYNAMNSIRDVVRGKQ